MSLIIMRLMVWGRIHGETDRSGALSIQWGQVTMIIIIVSSMDWKSSHVETPQSELFVGEARFQSCWHLSQWTIFFRNEQAIARLINMSSYRWGEEQRMMRHIAVSNYLLHKGLSWWYSSPQTVFFWVKEQATVRRDPSLIPLLWNEEQTSIRFFTVSCFVWNERQAMMWIMTVSSFRWCEEQAMLRLFTVKSFLWSEVQPLYESFDCD